MALSDLISEVTKWSLLPHPICISESLRPGSRGGESGSLPDGRVPHLTAEEPVGQEALLRSPWKMQSPRAL